jgi:hypothetical protein
MTEAQTVKHAFSLDAETGKTDVDAGGGGDRDAASREFSADGASSVAVEDDSTSALKFTLLLPSRHLHLRARTVAVGSAI